MSDFKDIGNFSLSDNGTFKQFGKSADADDIVIKMPIDCSSFDVSFDEDGTFTIDEVSE